MGRPRLYPQVAMTADKVQELASYGLHDDQIALFFGIEETTLKRRFAPRLKRGRLDIQISVRQKQLKVGLHDENPTMLIWLGKIYCHQSERLQFQGEVKHEHDFTKASTEELRSELAQLVGFTQVPVSGSAVARVGNRQGAQTSQRSGKTVAVAHAVC